ncbi:MAG: putative 5-dehydro-4-deoxyglucarate dehydratase 2 [Naasia sp.]|nr:putative 5-dehydro-4-deoxyglucarate dehydratase 2 [Naasia sp.]
MLGFPLSAFTEDGSGVDLDGFRAHLRRHLDSGVGGLFVCCGTGEFPSLDEDEYRAFIRTAVDEVHGTVPVIAGAGYGWALARRFAAIAEDEGADAILLMPHYLISAPQAGLIAQVEKITEQTDLPVVLYQRGQVAYTTETLQRLAEIPTVIGLKDGGSDFVELQRMTLDADPGFLFFNGALTAEIQYRAYAAVGISPYSSAVNSCVPEVAGAFFAATRTGDEVLIDTLLREFYSPLVALRDRVPGYAVSLIKSTARMRGERVGPVRAPLAAPTREDLVELERIMRHGLDLVGGRFDDQ